MENVTFKAHRRAFLFALVIASIYAFGYAVTGVVWFFFSFITTNFSANWTKACWTPGKSNVPQKLPSSFNIYASSGIWQGTASFQKFAPPYWSSIFNKVNLEVWKADHSLALRFRIALRPDQSRHATEISNKQSLNSELMNIPKFLDFSSQC